jgi:hypothetical protein
MNQKPVILFSNRLFSIILLVSLLLLNLGGNTVSSVQAQTGLCNAGRSQVVSLDGVDFQLCLPFTPDHSSVAEKNDWVQSGSWIRTNPHQEFSIYVIPYGINPSADNLKTAERGITNSYKKATLDYYRSDLITLIDGPSVYIFGNITSGTTYLLPDMNSDSPNSQKLVTEWIVEAGKRVWIIRSTLHGDFRDISIQQSTLIGLKSITLEGQNLNTLSTSLKEHGNTPTVPSQVNEAQIQTLSDLSTPSWWDGDCDTNRYLRITGISSGRLSVSPFRGLVACKPGSAGTAYPYGLITSFGAGVSQYEFQCAELPKRYLYLLYGIAPKSANGIDVVNVYDNALANLKKVNNGTSNSGLAAGDIVSYNGPTAEGHTAIITSVTIDANGNGNYTTIEQNSSATGERSNTISNWWLNSNSGISVYLHDSNSNNGSLNPPNPQSPNAGQTLTSRSVHFSWQSPNATNQSGYTFKLSTSSNPDASTPQPLKDTGLGNEYTSYDFNFSSDGTFYWHMRTWNTSNQASSWVTRSFTINTSGGGGNHPPAGFTWCADEDGHCSFSGTADVVYGAVNSFTSPRSFTNGVDCNNTIFSDPISGTRKACYYKASQPPSGNLHVEYFNDKNLGSRCYDGYENSTYVFKNWGNGSPANGCNSDNFSARFTGTYNFSGGSYTFHCQHDDGCRIFIDGQEKLNAWWDSSFTGHDWGGTLSGPHDVKIEFYDSGGDARLETFWSGAGFLPTGPGCTSGN